MLRMKGKIGQEIVIGDDITIKVLSFKNGEVQLGFELNDDTTVCTKEEYLSVQTAFFKNLSAQMPGMFYAEEGR